MKITVALRTFGTCAALLASCATNAISQPEPVPRMSERCLDAASYVVLAKQWMEYIDSHGETADALVNLGMARRYSGEMEAARLAGKRAVELEPENPRALAFYATVLSLLDAQSDEAIELLERCRAVAPDFADGLISLAGAYLRGGRLKKAEDACGTMFEQQIIPRPLQDFAYNMLIGLPEGAVLVTNGDDDTFAPIAMQSGMNLRTDVVVVNRHLLNAHVYADSLFREHELLRPSKTVKDGLGREASRAIIDRWLVEGKTPVYFAVTVPLHDLGLDTGKMAIEGLGWRGAGEGLEPEEIARLVLERYRLDSATDWAFGWDLVPNLSMEVGHNYVASLMNLAKREGVGADTRCRLLGKALAIAEFHGLPVKAQLEALVKKCGTR
ncbi:MAG: hypothetical protein PHQ19_05425 [Candidatus Krumholzibacteria bacterium]|nr:hypothetical protein [Candidatus Krumholzibacteria bacterium]